MSRMGSRACLILGWMVLVLALPWASGARAQTRPPRSWSDPASSFTCGPHALTYLSMPLDDGGGNLGVQVRCVIFDRSAGAGKHLRTPKMVWYGEGWYGNGPWPGTASGETDRHLGAAILQPGKADLVGYAANIFGNGETRSETFNGNITIHVAEGRWPAPTVLDVVASCGCYDDRWTLAGSVPYIPLKRPTTCGAVYSYYNQYSVAYAGHHGSGLRCVYQYNKSIVGWFGNGTMDGVSYTEIGYHTPHGFAVVDLCGPTFGTRCLDFPAGTVKLAGGPLKRLTGQSSAAPDRITATFAGSGRTWTERWTPKS